jgi:hypothetical protein
MDSNTHSTPPTSQAGLVALAGVLAVLAAQDPDSLSDAALAERVQDLRRLADQLEGHWLHDLAVMDARGAAGADQGIRAPSTAGWLRSRLHLSATAAQGAVRTARALFGGPLAATGAALTDGTISPAHARVLADGTHDLPTHITAKAEPVLLETARTLDPGRLRQAVAHLRVVANPDTEADRAERRYERRGLWLAPTWEGMVAVDGLLDPEAGQTLMAALDPLARPTTGEDERSASQRRADALTELARRSLEAGRLPQTGGVRPQLLVTVDLDTLLDRPGAVGGAGGWAGAVDPTACQRLACDGAVTRVLVSRQPPADPTDTLGLAARASGDNDLAARLRTAMTLLPPILGGALSQPLDVGRMTRVVQPAQRHALVVRDGGCVFPGCDRPPGWCEAHHLIHWLHGGPTDLDNLALLCRAHHRTVHEGGWRLHRGPDGQFAASPPHRRHCAVA